MDQFSFFFAFYGLILGLAVTELLGGFANLVRARRLQHLEPQTTLLAVLTFVIICATWIDAWRTERSVTLDFSGLWAPIIIGTTYYLAASVVFPRSADSVSALADYYAERKRFVLLMLVVAEIFITYTYRDFFREVHQARPVVFWIWTLPYKILIFVAYAGMWFARSRRANIFWLSAGLVLFVIPYAQDRWIERTLTAKFHYAPITP